VPIPNASEREGGGRGVSSAQKRNIACLGDDFHYSLLGGGGGRKAHGVLTPAQLKSVLLLGARKGRREAQLRRPWWEKVVLCGHRGSGRQEGKRKNLSMRALRPRQVDVEQVGKKGPPEPRKKGGLSQTGKKKELKKFFLRLPVDLGKGVVSVRRPMGGVLDQGCRVIEKKKGKSVPFRAVQKPP